MLTYAPCALPLLLSHSLIRVYSPMSMFRIVSVLLFSKDWWEAMNCVSNSTGIGLSPEILAKIPSEIVKERERARSAELHCSLLLVH